jgi:hypothetical protein
LRTQRPPDSGGAQRSAIAVTIIGGQSLCLFLTLLLVPVAYVQFDALEVDQGLTYERRLQKIRRRDNSSLGVKLHAP